MLRFRMLLVWLVMAAIPLQGLAAASMLFCGPGAHHASAQAITAQQTATEASTLTAASVSHDHAKHMHAGGTEVKKTADSTSKKLPDVSHKCNVCASCCQLLAIAQVPYLAVPEPLSKTELPEPFVLIHARTPPVPDKPPRV